MRRSGMFTVALAALTALAIAGPVSDAAASGAGIKRAIKSYEGKILVAEGHLLSAEGTYKATKVAAPVVAALEENVKVLTQLRSAVARQSAARPKIKQAKHLVLAGIGSLLTAYEKLKTAFSEKTVNETAAKAEAEKAVLAARTAKLDLRRAGKLLG